VREATALTGAILDRVTMDLREAARASRGQRGRASSPPPRRPSARSAASGSASRPAR
jgi:hypothetical protein